MNLATPKLTARAQFLSWHQFSHLTTHTHTFPTQSLAIAVAGLINFTSQELHSQATHKVEAHLAMVVSLLHSSH